MPWRQWAAHWGVLSLSCFCVGLVTEGMNRHPVDILDVRVYVGRQYTLPSVSKRSLCSIESQAFATEVAWAEPPDNNGPFTSQG
jgi:hypothetical protein